VTLNIIGEKPLATGADGTLTSRIGTVFPHDGVLLTFPPTTHALQRIHYAKLLDKQRSADGKPPLSDIEKDALWATAVDLIMTGKDIQIRPEPEKMPLAFLADKLLQTLVSKRNIRFLRARNPTVQHAIRVRGEYWRISPHPQEDEDIIAAIEKSKIAIGGAPIYFYNAASGTRYLTCQAFAELALLSDEALRQHLVEIRDFSAKRNKHYYKEVAFFGAATTFDETAFKGLGFELASIAQLRTWHAELEAKFKGAVPQHLRCAPDDFALWRNDFVKALTDEQNGPIAETVVGALTPEFFRKVKWLPGGRIENGVLVFDPIFENRITFKDDKELAELCDERVKGFICNYVREFGSLEYVNIGWVAPSLCKHHRRNGHRVYIAEVKSRSEEKPVLRILRIQQWGVREHLDDNQTWIYALSQAMEYTQFILDRRLACWELGMPLPARIDTRTIVEMYNNPQRDIHDARIWTVYFERDFIEGLATDKIPDPLMRDPDYALRVARLLGQAAAPNMVVGRTVDETSTNIIFDWGDEMILSDADGHPNRIVVADHAGTYHNYMTPLEHFAPGYAQPVVKRADIVPDLAAFTEAYLTAISDRLLQMQAECTHQRKLFAALFQNSNKDKGSFSDRWVRVFNRLEETHVPSLIARIRAEIQQAIKTA